MKKFFESLELNGVNWSECSTLIKIAGVLNILTLLLITATLIKIILLSGDFDNLEQVTLSVAVTTLLLGNVKVAYKK